MARGQKTPEETVYKVMASYAVTNNYSETARQLQLPTATVRSIVKAKENDEQFIKLQEEKKLEFSKAASDIIDKGLLLLNRRFDRAIEQEEMLDMFIDEIATTNKVQLSAQEKTVLITKLRGLQLHDVKAITTAIGTLFDKKALADGQPTNRVDIIGDDKIAKLAELAGYEKRD